MEQIHDKASKITCRCGAGWWDTARVARRHLPHRRRRHFAGKAACAPSGPYPLRCPRLLTAPGAG